MNMLPTQASTVLCERVLSYGLHHTVGTGVTGDGYDVWN